MLGSKTLKYSLLWLVFQVLPFNLSAQNDSIRPEISIDILVYVLDWKGEPLENVWVKMVKNDTIIIRLKTDSLGCAYGKIAGNSSYTIEANVSNRLSGIDSFATYGSVNTRRIIREIMIGPSIDELKELYRIEILYKKNSIEPVNIKDSLDIIEFYTSYLKEHPHVVIEIKCFRNKEESKNIGMKRSNYILTKLVERGINSDRLGAIDGGLKEFEIIDKLYYSEGIISIIRF